MKRKTWYLRTPLASSSRHRPFARGNPHFRENVKKLCWYLDRTDFFLKVIAEEFGVSRQAIFQAMERIFYDHRARASRIREKRREERKRREKEKTPTWYKILHRICRKERISCEPHSSGWTSHLVKLNRKSVYVRLTTNAKPTHPAMYTKFSLIAGLPPLKRKYLVAIQAIEDPPVSFVIPGRMVRTKNISLPTEKMVLNRLGGKRLVPSSSKWWRYKEAWHFIR